jgi:hypothetical protein
MKNCFKICKIYIQIMMSVYFMVTPCMAMDSLKNLCSKSPCKKAGRKPANFVPDDDLIVVPMIIEKSFVERFNDRHEGRFKSAKKTLEFWISQEAYAEAYGLESSGFVHLPTAEQKENFMQKHYLRFISKDLEKTTNSGIKNSWEEWTADDEIDAIQAIENHEKVLVRARKQRGKSELKATKTVKVGKSNVKFGFQPRVELGMLKFTMRTDNYKLRAWVGINGNQEVKLSREFKSTKTSAFINYYIDATRVLMAIDQRISRNWRLRYTHVKDFDKFNEWAQGNETENNIAQLMYGIRF